jgi:hypothetical protein
MKLTKDFLSNKTLTTLATLIIAIYAGLAAPALPNQVILFFDTWFGKILFMFLIAFVASHNFQIALMIAVLFFVVLQLATKLEVEKFQSEYFEDTEKEENDDDDETSDKKNTKKPAKKEKNLETEDTNETFKNEYFESDTTEMIKSTICNMINKENVDKTMKAKEYAKKNSKDIINKLMLKDSEFNKAVEKMDSSKTLLDLCKEKKESFETMDDETENFENVGFNPKPVDYEELYAGAPVSY